RLRRLHSAKTPVPESDPSAGPSSFAFSTTCSSKPSLRAIDWSLDCALCGLLLYRNDADSGTRNTTTTSDSAAEAPPRVNTERHPKLLMSETITDPPTAAPIP